MLKTLTFAVALGAMTALFSAGASALPATPVLTQDAGIDVTLVRDGCGRGQRFSSSRGRCVDSDRGFRGRDRDFRRGRSSRDDCRRGWRFSNRRGRCVRE
jgi:hypothetical protein